MKTILMFGLLTLSVGMMGCGNDQEDAQLSDSSEAKGGGGNPPPAPQPAPGGAAFPTCIEPFKHAVFANCTCPPRHQDPVTVPASVGATTCANAFTTLSNCPGLVCP
jgi:hypothetical protein